MSFLKRMGKLLMSEHILILLAVIVVAVLLLQYSSLKGTVFSGMKDSSASDSEPEQVQSEQVQTNVESSGLDLGIAYGAASADAKPRDLTDIKVTGSPNASLEPSSLMPAGGDIGQLNFLGVRQIAGIQAPIKKNMNLQLRCEVPNPQVKVSPWQQSTIEPLEQRNVLGC